MKIFDPTKFQGVTPEACMIAVLDLLVTGNYEIGMSGNLWLHDDYTKCRVKPSVYSKVEKFVDYLTMPPLLLIVLRFRVMTRKECGRK